MCRKNKADKASIDTCRRHMNTQNIKDKVLEQIHAGQVHMHSRAYFIWRALAISGTAIVAFLVAIFFASFVLFVLNESGEASLLSFGPRGFATFFSLLPWLIIGGVLALLVFLEFLLRSFKLGYSIPILRVFGAVAGISVLASALVFASPLHTTLLDVADNDALPLIGELYKVTHISHKEQGVFRGVVTSLASSSFTISHDDSDKDSDDGTWDVSSLGISPDRAPKVGEKVYIAGDVEDNVIHAYGIRKLPVRKSHSIKNNRKQSGPDAPEEKDR